MGGHGAIDVGVRQPGDVEHGIVVSLKATGAAVEVAALQNSVCGA